MDRQYWEKIAPGYNDEIFDVLQNDKQGIILKTIQELGLPSGSVIDVGCAVGKWLPVLSPIFRKITAVDISSGNLSIAKKNHSTLSNIEYVRADFSRGKTKLKGYNVAVCINAILTSSLAKRKIFFNNLHLCLKKGGKLVLVVPSLESWLLTRIIQHQWQIDKSLFADKLANATAAKRYELMKEGNVEIDNVATKHYLADELQLLLTNEGFRSHIPRKINYSWNTEFVSPPSWLKEPYPWDWMVLAEKL